MRVKVFHYELTGTTQKVTLTLGKLVLLIQKVLHDYYSIELGKIIKPSKTMIFRMRYYLLFRRRFLFGFAFVVFQGKL